MIQKKTKKSGYRKMVITKRYLNFPIASSEERKKMSIRIDDDVNREFVIRLSKDKIDYWVFADMAEYIGRTVYIYFPDETNGLDEIYQSDTIHNASLLYKEKYRPQIHYTAKRGWINDPNGLVYFDDEYHMFYQHNPYEAEWENMHWGHAVSRDLIHWEELNDVLFPDTSGHIFSGSAVIDKCNTAGWGEDTMIAAYTAHGKTETQCLAYSTDKGRKFKKYKSNPILDTTAGKPDKSARDPKIFWFKPGEHWVMALYEDNFISIYTSEDLKKWNYESKTVGFYECPELFELSVDGDVSNKKWIMCGASGTYMIGRFNGKQFTPEAGKYFYSWGSQYAAQTFNNSLDGRRIQIGWGRINHRDMPFNSLMLFPTELSLRTTPEGLRLFCNPIPEIKKMYSKNWAWTNISGEEANEHFADINSRYLHIKMDIELESHFEFSVNFSGNRILEFDGNWNQFNGAPYSGDIISPFRHKIELILDTTSYEAFIGNGRLFISGELKEINGIVGCELDFMGCMAVHKLEINELKSIWSK